MITDGQHCSPQVLQHTESSNGDSIIFIRLHGPQQQRGLRDRERLQQRIFWLTLSKSKEKDPILHNMLVNGKRFKYLNVHKYEHL